MTRRITLVLIVLLLVPVGRAAAQDTLQWDPSQVQLSREALQQLQARYEETAASSAYSGTLREQARRNAALIAARLRDGDFRTGDEVTLVVEGEEPLSKTFVVQDGPALQLPSIGTISLAGVLRSELESYLTKEIGRFIRNPVVQARSSIRLMITGGVSKEGYYVVPTTTVFPDLLMKAGGPAKGAKLTEIRVERNDQPIWQGQLLQQAINEGRTVDQLGLQAGDRVVVPQKSNSSKLRELRTVLMILSPIVLLTNLIIRLRR